MRPRVALISLLAGALGACGIDTSGPPRLGYAPPSVEPAEPGLASAGQPADLIWNQLLDRLIQSPLEVTLADPKRGIVAARYSGDPEPYVTCGWILVDRGGELEQVPASGEASLERVVQGRRLEVNRSLNLDARLVVVVKPDGGGAAVETSSNYVLTKTIVAEDPVGWTHGRAQEVISFSAGERGEFSKGTVCQPNGALERTVLDILPRATLALQDEGDAPAAVSRSAVGSGSAERAQMVESTATAPSTQTAETSAPASDRQTTESAGPGPARPTAEASGSAPAGETTISLAELPDPAIREAPDQTDQEEVPFECPIDDRTFCEVLDLTDPYRRANQERDLGLALDAMEADNALLDGSGLGFDISLPNYDSYLSVSYFLRDGTVRHVLSGSGRRWPANAREFVRGLGVDDRQSIAMVVALASDVPVFPSPRPPSETAELYLRDLRERLSTMSNGGAPAQIAASLVVITPA